MPTAIDCLISIIGTNQQLLDKLAKPIHHHAGGGAGLESLLEYFIDLVKDNDAKLRGDFFRFLSAACKNKDQGISINQDFIFH